MVATSRRWPAPLSGSLCPALCKYRDLCAAGHPAMKAPAWQRIACCAALESKATTSEISARNFAIATVFALPDIPHCRSVRSYFTRGRRHEMRPLPQIIGTDQPLLLGGCDFACQAAYLHRLDHQTQRKISERVHAAHNLKICHRDAKFPCPGVSARCCQFSHCHGGAGACRE